MLSNIDRCRAAPFKSSPLESLNPHFSCGGGRFPLSSYHRQPIAGLVPAFLTALLANPRLVGSSRCDDRATRRASPFVAWPAPYPDELFHDRCNIIATNPPLDWRRRLYQPEIVPSDVLSLGERKQVGASVTLISRKQKQS